MTEPAPASGRYWRWGAPLAVGLTTFACMAVAAWFWVNWSLAQVALLSLGLFATLLACWPLVHREALPPDETDGPAPIWWTGKKFDACLATVAITSGIVLAAYYLDVPLRIDETSTIGNYSRQPLSVVLTKYDRPNNHLFYTVLMWVVYQVGGSSRVAFRLPAFLSFCLLLPALWWFVRLEYGTTAATFATALVGPAPILVGYATNARGYTLLLLLFMVALLCARAVVRSPQRKGPWVGWAAAVASGCYTVPVGVFSGAMTVAWMLLVRRRICGADGMRPFAMQVVSWSAVALVAVVALYLPVAVVSAGGLNEMRMHLTGSLEMSGLQIVGHPVALWHQWHFPTPMWAQGVLLGLIVVGASVRAQSCGRRGTLLLAAALAWPLALSAYPLLKLGRYQMWALLVCRIMAGVGLAVVLSSALAGARARWPRVVATASRVRVVHCLTLAFVLGAPLWTRPGALGIAGYNYSLQSSLVMASAVAEQMRPGDYFASCNVVEPQVAAYLNETYAVDWGVAWYRPVDDLPNRLNVDRLSAAGSVGGDGSPGRIFLFEPVRGTGMARCKDIALGRDLMEARGTDHELLADFGRGSPEGAGAGRVYVVNDWVPD